jgi:hypothetical protein
MRRRVTSYGRRLLAGIDAHDEVAAAGDGRTKRFLDA